MEWLIIIVLWVVFALLVGEYATDRGRSAGGWFGLSFLFSPLLAFILLAVLPPVAGSGINSVFKKCPFCAETIRSEAKVCRYCGSELPAAAKPNDAPRHIEEPPKLPEPTSRGNWIVAVGVVVAVCVTYVAIVAYVHLAGISPR